MLVLSKKTDYALVSLAYLAERRGRIASAREIAEAAGLPAALLMQILKTLHQHGILRSTRGVKGGYEVGTDLRSLSLHTLITALHGPIDEQGLEAQAAELAALPLPHSPLPALRRRLLRFLQNVKVSDLIRHGPWIDVPVESVRVRARETIYETVREDQVQPA